MQKGQSKNDTKCNPDYWSNIGFAFSIPIVVYFNICSYLAFCALFCIPLANSFDLPLSRFIGLNAKQVFQTGTALYSFWIPSPQVSRDYEFRRRASWRGWRVGSSIVGVRGDALPLCSKNNHGDRRCPVAHWCLHALELTDWKAVPKRVVRDMPGLY